jgi:hypothetical protein
MTIPSTMLVSSLATIRIADPLEYVLKIKDQTAFPFTPHSAIILILGDAA